MALNRKAVVLFSGGLDSMLAIRIMQEQEIELEAFNVRTQFECCKMEASRMAHEFNVPITVVDTGPEYLRLIENPKNGWGKGINPCVDCRAHMFRLGVKFMEKVGASFLVTGEVMGQRPNSQLKHQLRKVELEAGLPGRILRPLSAKFLPPTEPEIEGIVDREKLYGIAGRSRRELMELAEKYKIKDVPQPSTGCRLTEPEYARRAKEAWEHEEASGDRWHYELLKLGRQLRLPGGQKIVIGRNEKENTELAYLGSRLKGVAYYEPLNFGAPSAVSVAGDSPEVRDFVGGAFLRYAREYPDAPEVEVKSAGATESFTIPGEPLTDAAIKALML